MSGFKRMLIEQMYLWERKQKLKQSKNTNKPINMPQIVGFRVDGGITSETPSYEGNVRRVRKRRGKESTDVKKLIGIGLICLGCFLLLTKCFGGNETLQQAEPIEEVSFETYIEDIALTDHELNELMIHSNKYQVPYAHTLAVWAYEHYLEEDFSKELLEQEAMIEKAESIYRQFIYDLGVYPLESNEKIYYDTIDLYRGEGDKEKRRVMELVIKDTHHQKMVIKSITSGMIEKIEEDKDGYGIYIQSEGGALFYYAPLQINREELKEGMFVFEGQEIGESETKDNGEIGIYIGIGAKGEEIVHWINPVPVITYIFSY